MNNIGMHLRTQREARGLTRRQLAERAGISESAIARLERGATSPTIITLEQIAKVLQVELVLELRRASDSVEPVSPDTESATPRVRVFVADAQPLFTQALAIALAHHKDLEVMYERSESGLALTGLEASAAVARIKPDVVLMEYWMPVMDGPAATLSIREWSPHTKVLITSAFHGPAQINASIEAGAAGFLPKSLEVDQVADAIRQAWASETIVYAEELSELSGTIGERARWAGNLAQKLSTLTPKEVDVLRVLSYGRSMGESADLLTITQGTLRIHVQSIMSKTGAASKSEAVAMAREGGLLQI